MKKAILIHGWASKGEFYDLKYPTASNSHWFPWLSKQLMMRDIHTVALEMPNSFYPEYETWKTELERFPLDEETVLVGHSCGGGFIVRYLSENNIKVGKVVLVAPWMGIMDTSHDMREEPFDETFFEFNIDRNLVAKTAGITLVESTNDASTVQESIKMLTDSISDINVVTVKEAGHFTTKDGYTNFPRLLEEIIK